MGLEDGREFPVWGNLLALKHTAARLIDHVVSQAEERSICCRMCPMARSANMSLPRFLPVFSNTIRALSTTSSATPISARYVLLALDGAASSSCAGFLGIRRRAARVRSRKPLIRGHSSALAKRPTQRVTRCSHVPQRVVGRMMNVGLHHRGVDAASCRPPIRGRPPLAPPGH